MNSILFRQVHTVDPSTSTVTGPVDVRVTGGAIAETGTNLDRSTAEIVIDGHGRFLMPGLIDAHVHVIAAVNDQAQLAAMPPYLVAAHAKRELTAILDRGFTTVRDAGGAEGGLATAVREGLFDGPRLFPAGLGLAQSGGLGDFRRGAEPELGCHVCRGARAISRVVDGPDEVRRACREEFRSGATQIKVFASSGNSSTVPIQRSHFSIEELTAAADEAAAHGSYVMAHAYGSESVRRAVDAGARTIEHGNLIDEDTAKSIAGRAYVVPTLATYEASLRHRADFRMSPQLTAQVENVLEAGVRSLELCRRAGVQLGFGTDLEGFVRQYQSREFAIRARVETPAQVLNSAITVNAEILRVGDTLGKVEPGYEADLLLVPRNPLEDLSVFADSGKGIDVVVSRGRLHKTTPDVS